VCTASGCRFDYGVDMLAGFIGNISGAFPVLSCNLDTSAEPALEGLVQRYALIDLPIANITIGVVGLTSVETPETSNPGKAAAECWGLRGGAGRGGADLHAKGWHVHDVM
jgi:2',3'-cyclic-nucleotide 2'-phosphodiesterase (5'-nucleotidase family)